MLIRRNNQITNYNPFHEIENLERSLWGEPFGNYTENAIAFRTDITDEGDSFMMTADLPGFKKENIHLDIEGDYLTISAERHSDYEDKEKAGKYLRIERSFGKFSRSFELGGIDREQIKAKYEDGILKLTLPKLVEKIPASRRLEIE